MTDTDDSPWNKYGDVLTAAELGEILRLKAPSVLVRLRNGTVPAHWIAGSWIIFTAEVKAWLPTTLSRPAASKNPDSAETSSTQDPGKTNVDVLAGYDDVLNYDDLVRLFGKNKSTIYRWLNDGTIPAYQDHAHWIIHKSQLRQSLAETSNQTS